jgi:hypothetical protein
LKLRLEWSKPVELTSQRLGYDLNLDRIEQAPGIYVFGRRHGDTFEALYVGKATNLRSRAKNQLNNLRLMQHLKDAKTGKRLLLPAVFRPGQAQQISKCLPLIERALIRRFLAEGHDLVNVQGTRIRRHEILSTQRPGWIVPEVVFLER